MKVGIVAIGRLGYFGMLYAKVSFLGIYLHFFFFLTSARRDFPRKRFSTWEGKRHLRAEKIVAISRSNSKKEEALKLGADVFIATGGDDPDKSQKHSRTLDLIISIVSAADMALYGYLSLLRTRGTFL